MPLSKKESAKSVRGSPKLPRIGCCLKNGRTGHGYAAAPAGTRSASKQTRMGSEKRWGTARKTRSARPRVAVPTDRGGDQLLRIERRRELEQIDRGLEPVPVAAHRDEVLMRPACVRLPDVGCRRQPAG